MWSMIVSLVQGIVTGVVGPVFTYLGKKQDTTLAGFQSAVSADVSQAAAQQAFIEATNAEKAQANAWWGPRVLYMLVGTTAALHTAAIFLDSTVRFGCGHYGCLGVPTLPGVYADYERMIVYSLFVVSTIAAPVSAVTQWLHRK